MATRVVIGKLQTDGSGIKAIYLHSDGYLEHAGRILNEHYQDESKVDELLAHGEVSIVDENIGVKIDFNDYKTRYANKQCKFYMRDRGEKYKQAEQFYDENDEPKFVTSKGTQNPDDYSITFRTKRTAGRTGGGCQLSFTGDGKPAPTDLTDDGLAIDVETGKVKEV